MTAPLGSTTLPEMEPIPDWAAADPNPNKPRKRKSRTVRVLTVNAPYEKDQSICNAVATRRTVFMLGGGAARVNRACHFLLQMDCNYLQPELEGQLRQEAQ
jgi:hypothetical protein